MERELIISGIGGQGIQLASAILARAAVDEGREVQVFGSYGGMMRGGATESTVIVADGPIEAPPTIATTWSAILMHHEHADHLLACLRPGTVVLVNDSVVPEQASGRVVWFRGSRRRHGHRGGQRHGRIDGDDRGLRGGDRNGGAALPGRGLVRVAPRVPRPARRAQRAGVADRFRFAPPGSAPAWHDRRTAGR